MSVFSLGIMPYITAQIILQLMQAVIPGLGELAKEGEAGQRKITVHRATSRSALLFSTPSVTCSSLAATA